MQLIRDHNPQAQTLLSKLHQVVHLPLVDEATAVGVGVPDPAAALPAAEPPADAADGPLQLLAADAPVPVGVELHQPLLELLHRHVPVHRPGGGGGGARAPDGHGNTRTLEALRTTSKLGSFLFERMPAVWVFCRRS